MGSATQWEYQRQRFSDDNRVIALDWRGHRLADKPDTCYSMAELVAGRRAALDVLGVPGKAVPVGYSFGGALAAEYAAAYPERVEKLVLIAASGEFWLATNFRLALSRPLVVLRLAEPFTRHLCTASCALAPAASPYDRRSGSPARGSRIAARITN